MKKDELLKLYNRQLSIQLDILKLLQELNNKVRETNQEYFEAIKKLHKLDNNE